jgi:hypothetical protein
MTQRSKLSGKSFWRIGSTFGAKSRKATYCFVFSEETLSAGSSVPSTTSGIATVTYPTATARESGVYPKRQTN